MSDNKTKNVIRKIFGLREINLILVIIFICIILFIITSNFLKRANLISILLTASSDAIVAIGMTILLASGGFDLSVGSIAGWGGVMAGIMLVNANASPALAIIVSLISCIFIGYLNGLIITKLKVNPLITTIAMLSIVRGAVFIFTKGLGVPVLPDNFNIIGKKVFFHIQIPVYITIILIILFDIMLRNSVFFRQYYFIGSSEESARLTGIKVDNLKILGYIISALLAGFAGILIAARFGGAYNNLGMGMELRVVIACVIGGCSLAGGEGTILGSFLGVIFMGIVVNALNLLGVSMYSQQAILGSVLLFAVLFDATRKKIGLRFK